MDVSYSALMVPWSSYFYQLAKSAPNPTEFILSREIVTNLSRALFLPFLMLLAALLPPIIFFKVSFMLAIPLTLLFLVATKQKINVFK
jgi:hypothetical protein